MLSAAIVVLVILALIAVNMLLLLVSAWLLAYAGIFLLGFGGSRWTSDIAISFYKTVLGIGIQLFTMTFLIGVGKSFLDQYYKAFEVGTPDLNSLCVLLVASVILLTLVNKLPPMLAGIVGTGGQASGIGSFGAGAALGVATMAASAVASAGSAALSGAKELAGGASAVSAAFKSAQANMEGASNDTGTLMRESATDLQASGSQGQSAFGQAMGSGTGQESGYASRLATGGRLAANAASIVADHVGEIISNRASGATAATAGGRLATAIDESSKKSQSGDNPVFEDISLSMRSDEISDFVNNRPPQD
ncbi:P-type conjugative transfer protein TrbL [Pseudomonas sp. DCB_CB]|nr:MULTISPECIES: P-type conjugative transfer protein TrbL [unclassified Pseudomonas]MCX2693811.1 P-type conjugative transfer protein TrbL [Pseudomonas sp. DCB_BZ]MCX2858995.1 P-type conjugative transfer protein TrbL [Pseudomonas sp. DCB_CB]